jgi:hypothetical protein
LLLRISQQIWAKCIKRPPRWRLGIRCLNSILWLGHEQMEARIGKKWFSKPRIFSQNFWANLSKPGWNRDVEILVINWPGSNCSRRGLQYMTWSECIRSAWQRAKIDLKPHDTTHAIWCNARTLNHEQHPSIFHEYHTTKSAQLFTVLSKYNLLHLLKVEASRDVGTF